MSLVLSGDIKTVLKDRGDDSQYHLVELSYVVDQKNVKISLKIKTRGNFRKASSNFKYPPLMLNFPKSKIYGQHTFSGSK